MDTPLTSTIGYDSNIEKLTLSQKFIHLAGKNSSGKFTAKFPRNITFDRNEI